MAANALGISREELLEIFDYYLQWTDWAAFSGEKETCVRAPVKRLVSFVSVEPLLGPIQLAEMGVDWGYCRFYVLLQSE
jgi:hypothetical protein